MHCSLEYLCVSMNWWRGTCTCSSHNYTHESFSTGMCLMCSFAGPLPSPENVTLSSQNSSTQLQWKPPYYMMNQESDVIHVDPHITQYTVYITDACTRRMNDSMNVTETSFLFSSKTKNDVLCPMYQVSAWNAGGEGELSDPVQESTPQGS